MIRVLILSILVAASSLHAAEPQSATFAGGCFWCVEEAFDHVEGVLSTTSGYTNGNIDNPSNPLSYKFSYGRAARLEELWK